MTMPKKHHDFKFELNIDGESYPPEKVSPLFQQDPFPGGHNYSCVISANRLDKHFYDLPFGKSANVSEEDARNFFLSLQFKWNPDSNAEDVKLEYFLNNVEEIDFDGERLRFSGVCSPVLRN